MTYEKFDTDEIPCIFCPARISSKGNAGMYPILGHMMGLHGKEKHWPCNKCDYRSDKMDLFFQHYKKHLNPWIADRRQIGNDAGKKHYTDITCNSHPQNW